jgi:hypothetical protein
MHTISTSLLVNGFRGITLAPRSGPRVGIIAFLGNPAALGATDALLLGMPMYSVALSATGVYQKTGAATWTLSGSSGAADIAALQSSVAGLLASTAALQAETAALGAVDTALAGDIAALQAANTALTGGLNALNARVTAAESTLVTNSANIVANANAIGVNTASIATVDGRVDSANAAITAIDTRVTALETLTVTTLFNWTYYATHWDSAPVLVKSIAGGDVYSYTYSAVTRYRFVPGVYNSTLDAFYSNFDSGTDTLSGLIAQRGQ